MYFSFFGTILYDNEFIADLSKKISAIELEDPRFFYDNYYVQNGERPDSVSNKFYDVPYYHWILLATNNMTIKTWPKSDAVMSKYMDYTYGGVPTGIEYYQTTNGLIVPQKFPASFEDSNQDIQEYYFNGDGLGGVQDNIVYNLGQPVKTYDVLISENDAKKNIRVLDKRYIPEITDLAQRLLASR